MSMDDHLLLLALLGSRAETDHNWLYHGAKMFQDWVIFEIYDCQWQCSRRIIYTTVQLAHKQTVRKRVSLVWSPDTTLASHFFPTQWGRTRREMNPCLNPEFAMILETNGVTFCVLFSLLVRRLAFAPASCRLARPKILTQLMLIFEKIL